MPVLVFLLVEKMTVLLSITVLWLFCFAIEQNKIVRLFLFRSIIFVETELFELK